jgi:hypothetical protein
MSIRLSLLSLSVPFLDCAIVAFFTLSVALRASFSATFHRSDKAKLCPSGGGLRLRRHHSSVSSVCEPVFQGLLWVQRDGEQRR